ncbi:MAG TPA: hypothetical protein VGU25_12830 [Acidobacteriaceae bacterium]|nr:hypothetical protein [Acidobacteriaceae bacterium]
MMAVQALLAGAIDYAGLFPPAALDLETTVRNYADYRSGRDEWALGRLVLPAGKVAEFGDRWPEYVEWPISLLLGSDYDAEMRLAIDVGLRLDAVECRPERLENIAEIRRRMPSEGELFVEAPSGCAPEDLIAAAATAGACAKIRTGGVVPQAVPPSNVVAAFLTTCVRQRVRMKATAGLHHAIRGEQKLTYEPQSATAYMHGFVNLFVAAAAAYQGADEGVVSEILGDEACGHFDASENELRWRERSFSMGDIRKMRDEFLAGFGSCSFEEPIEELRAMGWIR